MTVRMTFGKHKGERITRVPVGYLRWMVNTGSTPMVREAQEELDRRGTVLPEIEISPHAIDRFSQRRLAVWQEHREGDEGLYAFMHRAALEAYAKITPTNEQVRKKRYGATWVFERGEHYPILKTVL